jgi:hypothetical protein
MGMARKKMEIWHCFGKGGSWGGCLLTHRCAAAEGVGHRGSQAGLVSTGVVVVWFERSQWSLCRCVR